MTIGAAGERHNGDRDGRAHPRRVGLHVNSPGHDRHEPRDQPGRNAHHPGPHGGLRRYRAHSAGTTVTTTTVEVQFPGDITGDTSYIIDVYDNPPGFDSNQQPIDTTLYQGRTFLGEVSRPCGRTAWERYHHGDRHGLPSPLGDFVTATVTVVRTTADRHLALLHGKDGHPRSDGEDDRHSTGPGSLERCDRPRRTCRPATRSPSTSPRLRAEPRPRPFVFKISSLLPAITAE